MTWLWFIWWCQSVRPLLLFSSDVAHAQRLATGIFAIDSWAVAMYALALLCWVEPPLEGYLEECIQQATDSSIINYLQRGMIVSAPVKRSISLWHAFTVCGVLVTRVGLWCSVWAHHMSQWPRKRAELNQTLLHTGREEAHAQYLWSHSDVSSFSVTRATRRLQNFEKRQYCLSDSLCCLITINSAGDMRGENYVSVAFSNGEDL